MSTLWPPFFLGVHDASGIFVARLFQLYLFFLPCTGITGTSYFFSDRFSCCAYFFLKKNYFITSFLQAAGPPTLSSSGFRCPSWRRRDADSHAARLRSYSFCSPQKNGTVSPQICTRFEPGDGPLGTIELSSLGDCFCWAKMHPFLWNQIFPPKTLLTWPFGTVIGISVLL